MKEPLAAIRAALESRVDEERRRGLRLAGELARTDPGAAWGILIRWSPAGEMFQALAEVVLPAIVVVERDLTLRRVAAVACQDRGYGAAILSVATRVLSADDHRELQSLHDAEEARRAVATPPRSLDDILAEEDVDLFVDAFLDHLLGLATDDPPVAAARLAAMFLVQVGGEGLAGACKNLAAGDVAGLPGALRLVGAPRHAEIAEAASRLARADTPVPDEWSRLENDWHRIRPELGRRLRGWARAHRADMRGGPDAGIDGGA